MMNLYQYRNKKVTLIINDGTKYTGIACDYIPAQDNDNEASSICIGDYEFYEYEIKTIELA